MNIRTGFYMVSLLASVSLTTGLFKSFRALDFGYAAFIRFPNSKLNVGGNAMMYVESPTQCALGCAVNLTCQSFNLGTQPVLFDRKMQFACELLPTNKFNSSSNFQTLDANFHHYTIQVS
jgi:hypothetical protein